jgi:hypothetical protein
MKLTIEEKVHSTINYAKSLIAAGWDREEAIQNSRNLWNISNKRMQEVKIAIPKSNADLWEESNMRAAAFANY